MQAGRRAGNIHGVIAVPSSPERHDRERAEVYMLGHEV
eukprot:SAG25_NODE_11267_length_309_cov_0.733333_1_plen_37_part_10